ncbi:MAG: acriflavin resistance protein [Rhodocyclaceae bacterium]|nr:acriflavin resistance protein [Rhodocyclaceae bacterium]
MKGPKENGRQFGPNLSAWALRHQSMVLYLMVVLLIGGVLSYFKLGRAEDPDFTFKVMFVRTFWPGATTREVEQQVTERLEKKLQETPWVDVLRSYSKPGESMVFVLLKDYTPPKEVPDAWYQVRKKIADIRHTLPAEVQGPFFNDEFGDTFGIIYALTGDGFSLAELRSRADTISRELLRLPDVKKVDLLGVQEEKIYVEISHAKLATLGLDPNLIIQTLQSQNAMTPGGQFDTADDRVYLRVSGDFENVEHIRDIGIRANGRNFRLGDIARVYRGYADPPSPRFRWRGQEAIGVALAMAKGGNVQALGQGLEKEIARIRAELPAGIELQQVSNQPAVVDRAVSEFMATLAEALVIVLAVSFLSLGLRTGMVVALSIPLVLAATFLAMKSSGIDLQRISLGALIIALGLLVDDAIIAVEMMVVKMEQGWDRFKAATFAYTSTAFPMLTGTLVTAAGFMPVGFARSAAGEYTFSIFAVVTIALLVSWVVAVVFTPYIGYRLLDPAKLKEKLARHGTDDIYGTPFYRRFRALVTWCVARRWTVIGITLAIFVASIAAFNLGVEKQFFPSSNRPELLVDLWLPQGSSIKATEREARRVEALLDKDEAVAHYVDYIGSGSPRFYLPLDQQMPNDNFAQFVVTTHGDESREALLARLKDRFETGFPLLRARVLRLENGPPVGFPVQFRVLGPEPAKLRSIAAQVAEVMRANPHTRDVHLDWNEMAKQVKLEVDQDKARALGLSSQELSAYLNTLLAGLAVTQFREGDRLIDVVGRAEEKERLKLSALQDLNIHTRDGRYVPLAQVATISSEMEEGIVWRRNRQPTITVRADLRDKTQAPVVSKQIEPALAQLQENLAAAYGPGYRIETGGAIEESAKAEASIQAVMPLMIVTVFTLLMLQLQSFQRTLMVVLTAPLGLIGVTLSLLIFHTPFGFVAQLGVIALAGMIMRNSVILVDQIEQDIAEGKAPWEAVIDSTVRRFRPIMLTALAAILAMIPLSRSVFWGPMAIAIMGGLLVATVLTLLFLPALYAAWYKVKPGDTDYLRLDSSRLMA